MNNAETHALKALESASGIIMFSLDKAYCYTSFTPSHQQVMKQIWNADIEVGDNMLKYLSAADRDKAKLNFDRALKGEHFSSVEEYGDATLQRSFWEDRYDPILNNKGEVTGVVVFVLDVSKLMNTTRQLQEAQARLQLALKASKTGVWEWNIETNAIHWSDEVYDIFYLPRTTTIDYDFYRSTLHPDDARIVEEIIGETLVTGKDYFVEHRFITPQNEVRWIRGVGELILRDGKPSKLLGIVHDITDIRNSETESAQWRTRYDLIVKSSNQIVYDYHVSTGTIVWSGNTVEVLGYTNEEMGDFELWGKRVHPEDKSLIIELLEASQHGLSKFDVTYRFQHANGVYKILSDRGFFFRDSGPDKGVRMLGIMEDITQEKEAELELVEKNEALTKANQELDKFVYSASHDLRAPIASLLGLISVARMEKSPEALEELWKMQERSLNKLDAFIRDIVDYSRNARTPILHQEVNSEQIIQDIFDQLYFFDNLRMITRTVDVRLNQPLVTDGKRLEIILKNLISNAIKYVDLNKPTPRIDISIESVGPNTLIHVEDNGEGIREENLSRIFEMFFRASEKRSGTGLGLYIVKETVQKLNGTVQVQSTYGLGTKITLSLPR